MSDADDRLRCFLVDEKLAIVLVNLPPERRNIVLGHAFALAFGIDDEKPSDPMDNALAVAVANVSDVFDGRRAAVPMTSAERVRKFRSKKTANGVQDTADETKCNEMKRVKRDETTCNGETLQINKQTNVWPTLQTLHTHHRPPTTLRATPRRISRRPCRPPTSAGTSIRA